MEINFTIVVQAVNFFIGFVLLRQLLFKPVFAYLQNEEKKENSIKGKILDQEKSLDKKVEKKQNTWEEYQKHFQKTSPPLLTKKIIRLEETVDEPEVIAISAKEVDYLTQHIQKALVQRMEYVRE